MNLNHLRGSLVALVTPFDQEGNPDFERLGYLIDWHLAAGTDGIVILGTTGREFYYDTRRRGRCSLQVYRGACFGQNSGHRRQRLQLYAVYAGAEPEISGAWRKRPAPHSAFIITRLTKRGMVRHFLAIADQVEIPCILYNVPGRTGCSIPVSVVKRLAAHPRIAGIKEASGDMGYAMEIAALLSEDFVMYSGNDDITVPLLSIGATGVISVLANILPAETHRMVWDYLNGDTEGAAEMQLRYLELIHCLFSEVNPIPVKTALALMGKM